MNDLDLCLEVMMPDGDSDPQHARTSSFLGRPRRSSLIRRRCPVRVEPIAATHSFKAVG